MTDLHPEQRRAVLAVDRWCRENNQPDARQEMLEQLGVVGYWSGHVDYRPKSSDRGRGRAQWRDVEKHGDAGPLSKADPAVRR